MAVFVETEQALLAHQGLNFPGIRKQHFNLNAVMLAHFLDELVGFRVQPAGVQGEHLQVVRQLVGHFDQHHIFRTTEGNGDVVVAGEGGFQDSPGALAVQFGAQRIDISHVVPAIVIMLPQGYHQTGNNLKE